MVPRATRALVAFVVVLGVQSHPGGPAAIAAGPAAGGVYFTAVEDLGAIFSARLDPSLEYTAAGWGFLSQMLTRTLLSYRHVAGPAGTVPVPDLATDAGTVSADGLTYTFTLKDGIRFGPPVSRPITSDDVAYAFERLAAISPAGGGYPVHYEAIDGFVPHPWPPTPIPGIDTPDPATIVFHLTRPQGDFLHRLAMPAAAPIPPEVGNCFPDPGAYGRDLVPSGPYMFAGADEVDVSSCETIRPMRGWNPAARLVLVRNPDYDPATDNPEVRESLIDGVRVSPDPSTSDIFARIRSGELTGSLTSDPPPSVIRDYLQDPGLKPLLHSDGNQGTFYLTMNLLVPPFDDVHVRRAINFVVDKRAMLKAFNGPAFGEIATALLPPGLSPNPGYDPYPTPEHAGDLAAAQAEMSMSPYDTDADGVCDAAHCSSVRFVTRNLGGYKKAIPSLEASLAGIGITLAPETYGSTKAYRLISDVAELVPFSGTPGWGADFLEPSNFFTLFHSSRIYCEGQLNYAEVGMLRSQARDCGVLDEWLAARPPSMDDRIDACEPLTGAARTSCWSDLEHVVMERVVPWVPYRWDHHVTIVTPAVTTYEHDAFGRMISFSHIALAAS
jgi:peptide/nickel transport system substrate-binding protein